MTGRTRKILGRAALVLWVAAVGALIVVKGRQMDWSAVVEALRSVEPMAVLVALALAVPAFLACASFDLVGRYTTGHDLPVGRVMLISFTGYFFSLNLGALVGGLAFRYRLYMPYGLSAATIGQVIGLAIITNWSGYVPVAGAVLVWAPPELPPSWGVGSAVMRWTGVALLVISAAYLALCALRGGTRVRWRETDLELPTLGIAAVQLFLSAVSWGSIGAVLAWVLPGEVTWFAVMPVLMISAIAGIWSHVPSGLGVVELVFVALLGHLAPEAEILAAILVYRVVYYLAPFAAAVLAYAYLEVTARRARAARGAGRRRA